jgi:hypothetical protein
LECMGLGGGECGCISEQEGDGMSAQHDGVQLKVKLTKVWHEAGYTNRSQNKPSTSTA